ncbi:hypothetical protein, partial [Kaistella sp.]|uniref:hypothetical protein n=1 Tax=Kaistella sp. TaxID=2782235 RepID=UPI002F922829
ATNLANLLSTPKNILNNQSNISDLNKTMENVLNSTKGEDVSILVSDFIYSVDNNQSLAFAGDITKSIFQNASRKISGLSVLLVHLESNFTGNYYDMNNMPTLLNNAKRPYYIMIVGSNQNIERFSQKINIPALKGYKGSYFLASESLKPYSEHIYSKDSKGILKTDNTNPNLIIVRRTDNNTVQFSLAVNLQRYPDQQLLLNPQNYNLSNGYELVKIEKIPNNNIPQVVDPNVWVNL